MDLKANDIFNNFVNKLKDTFSDYFEDSNLKTLDKIVVETHL